MPFFRILLKISLIKKMKGVIFTCYIKRHMNCHNIRFRQNCVQAEKILFTLYSCPGRIIQEDLHPQCSCKLFNF